MRESKDMILEISIRIKHQVLYVKSIKITNERDDLKIKYEIGVRYDCILKLT